MAEVKSRFGLAERTVAPAPGFTVACSAPEQTVPENTEKVARPEASLVSEIGVIVAGPA